MTEQTDFGYRKVPTDEKVHWVRRHFNSIAGKYDFMNTLLSFGLHYLWKREAVKRMQLKPGDRVLDVCGGTADLSILAGRAVGAGGQVFLYDINRAMMEAGKPKVLKSGLADRVRFIQGDAERISFPAGTFDAACVGFGIRNLTRMENGLAEMYRVLKPGGAMVCLEFSIPPSTPFKALYDLYSFLFMPMIGQILTGSRQAYTYLPESIRLFPLPGKFAGLLAQIGFTDVCYHRLTQGIAVIHFGKKSVEKR
jgi:demethylmenaquinone methyltransferase / 2-methoxy-6-polyprenyl-1,4-benzoquinol methylase